MKVMKEEMIHSSEFDAKARRAFAALDAMLDPGEPSERDKSRAEACMKMLSMGTRRMGSEANKAAQLSRISRDTGRSDALKTALALLGVASSDAEPETPDSLASTEQTSSRAERVAKRKAS